MYKRPRIIPCITMQHQDMVKTLKFKNPRYIGDPINSVRIFNNKDIDEMCILDITATEERREPDFKYLHEIASEAFIPLGYGGGITSLEQAKKIFRSGYEKVIINTLLFENPEEVKRIVGFAGSQSVVASVDYKKDLFGKNQVVYKRGKVKSGYSVSEAVVYVEYLGVGEILLTSIAHEGSMKGFDLKTVFEISESVSIPIIINGGAGKIEDIKTALDSGADAVAASSMFIYCGANRAVLINTPYEAEYYRLNIYED